MAETGDRDEERDHRNALPEEFAEVVRFCDDYLAKALAIYQTADSDEERMHALGYALIGITEFAHQAGISRTNTFPISDLMIALDEMPDELRHALASKMGGKLHPRSEQRDNAATLKASEKDPPLVPEASKGGGQYRSYLRTSFMCWVAACYDYLKEQNMKKAKKERSPLEVLQKIIAEACGYGNETKKIQNIYNRVMGSKDQIFRREHEDALGILKKMPADTPQQNVKRALKLLVLHTPPNLLSRPRSNEPKLDVEAEV